MNKKLLIFIIAVIVVAIVAAAIYFLVAGSGNANPGTGTSTGTLPYSSSTTGGGTSVPSTSSIPTTDSFQIGTSQGSVTVNNFYKTQAYTTQDNETVVLVENDNYSIVYNRDDSGFIISLISVPDSLQAARDAAESDFLSHVGVSQTDACKLNVDESVIDKNSSYDGESLGLSFCPGAIIP